MELSDGKGLTIKVVKYIIIALSFFLWFIKWPALCSVLREAVLTGKRYNSSEALAAGMTYDGMTLCRCVLQML